MKERGGGVRVRRDTWIYQRSSWTIADLHSHRYSLDAQVSVTGVSDTLTRERSLFPPPSLSLSLSSSLGRRHFPQGCFFWLAGSHLHTPETREKGGEKGEKKWKRKEKHTKRLKHRTRLNIGVTRARQKRGGNRRQKRGKTIDILSCGNLIFFSFCRNHRRELKHINPHMVLWIYTSSPHCFCPHSHSSTEQTQTQHCDASSRPAALCCTRQCAASTTPLAPEAHVHPPPQTHEQPFPVHCS